MKFLATILILLCTSSVFASSLTPDSFMKNCDEKSSKIDQIVCLYYFIGYTHGLIAGSYVDKLSPDFKVSPMSTADTLQKYVKKNPDKGKERLDEVVLESLLDDGKVNLRKDQ